MSSVRKLIQPLKDSEIDDFFGAVYELPLLCVCVCVCVCVCGYLRIEALIRCFGAEGINEVAYLVVIRSIMPLQKKMVGLLGSPLRMFFLYQRPCCV